MAGVITPKPPEHITRKLVSLPQLDRRPLFPADAIQEGSRLADLTKAKELQRGNTNDSMCK